MRHIENAYNKLENEMDKDSSEMGLLNFIKLDNVEDTIGVAPTVSFTIQSDPISEVGINGVQALDILKYTKCLFQSLNDAFPCRENSLSITKIEEAIHWQEARTKDRLRRNVEGKNKK